MATKDRVTIMIDRKQLRDVDKIAKALKRSRSEVVGMALEAYLEDSKLGVEAFTNPLIAESMLKAFGNREVMRALVGALGQQMDEAKLVELEGLFTRLQQDQGKRKGGVKS